MRKRDALKLEKDDEIVLKHHLGDGRIIEVLMEPSENSIPGRYPMIRYEDRVTHDLVWCTHRVISEVTRPLRSVK